MAHEEAIVPAEPRAARGGDYQVVARRYRPQTFEQLVGQEHVGAALANAITTGRIGHAYLFTGARGVGKTSTARIFAKALNCQRGLSPLPCDTCDACRGIASGEDVDVLEIDGASNRGIDEIRQLRQNASIRPSRSRYKIYIIDEVHMLTREAFNALLKTLEEPPEHVKFIFCTTEATKIPVTILSRCQRFDFAGIEVGSISERLRQIAQSEGVEIDGDALRLLSRRAAGSMRDAQSLLEQLLAFCSGKITAAEIHAMLGTASEDRLAGLVDCLLARDPAGAMASLDLALHEGVDVALLVEQLFGYLRDVMVASVGASSELFLFATAAGAAHVRSAAEAWRLETILAAMQILENALFRMRYSTQGRLLAELAVVRICRLEDMHDLASLIAELRTQPPSSAGSGRAVGGMTPPQHAVISPQPVASPRPAAPALPVRPPVKKKGPDPGDNDHSSAVSGAKAIADEKMAVDSEPLSSGEVGDAGEVESPAEAAQTIHPMLSTKNAASVWETAVTSIDGMLNTYAKSYVSVAISAPNTLVVCLPAEYSMAKSVCERAEQKFEDAVSRVVGQPVRVRFQLAESGRPGGTPPKSARPAQKSPEALLREASGHPLVQKAVELFGATTVEVLPPSSVAETPRSNGTQ